MGGLQVGDFCPTGVCCLSQTRESPISTFFSSVTYCGKNCKLQSKEKEQLAKAREGIQCLAKGPFLREPGKKHHFSDREKFWIPCSLKMPERANCDSESSYKELVRKQRRNPTDSLSLARRVCGCFPAHQAGPPSLRVAAPTWCWGPSWFLVLETGKEKLPLLGPGFPECAFSEL